MKSIRTTLTFTFNPASVSERAIKDRLDAALEREFAADDLDLHTRWVATLADAPFAGAGKRFRGERP